MDAITRRNSILTTLLASNVPISATTLASTHSVSRQLVVGDIALLRARGAEILATPRGYLIPQATSSIRHIVACVHTQEDMGCELELMVDNGCEVVDVSVEHPVYGQLVGQLHLSNRYDVAEFLRHAQEQGAKPLSHLTGGIHLHTLSCPDEACHRRTLSALEAAGFLLAGQAI